jgi:thioredoxin 1
MVANLNQSDFQKNVLNAKGVVFVDFYAEWCGPCKMTGPIIDELAKEYEGKAVFYKINVDENNQLAGKYNVFSIPTFIIFKDGQPVDQFVGALGKEGFEEHINKVIV